MFVQTRSAYMKALRYLDQNQTDKRRTSLEKIEIIKSLKSDPRNTLKDIAAALGVGLGTVAKHTQGIANQRRSNKPITINARTGLRLAGKWKGLRLAA